MARTLENIYTEAKNCRNQYLELTEVENTSKMSILDAFTWVTSTCIWAFENIIDVFKVDLAKELQYRINGTPSYFANALLKYQSGDILTMNDEGTMFSYANIDPSKRIITKVAYNEEVEEGFHDKSMRFKIATTLPDGSLAQIDNAEMIGIRSYLNQLLFAGQQAKVVSRIGDVLVPRIIVYYDGDIAPDELYKDIEDAIQTYLANIDFNGVFYVQKVIDAIQGVKHVKDVSALSNNNSLGIYVASYDDDNNLIYPNGEDSPLTRIERYYISSAGYFKQSTAEGAEKDIPRWRDTIILRLEDDV